MLLLPLLLLPPSLSPPLLPPLLHDAGALDQRRRSA
jgi:hypothetical protein